LRAQIKAGIDALDRGDFVEVDDAELDDYLEGLTAPSDKRAR
jgi:antitoxin ParD1/3/4